jgi:hypothetical protein
VLTLAEFVLEILELTVPVGVYTDVPLLLEEADILTDADDVLD